MTSSRSAARDVAEELEAEECAVVTAEVAREKVKSRGLESPWENKIEEGFEERGWSVEDGLYYRPEQLAEKVRVFSDKLRSESRAVVSRAVVGTKIAKKGRPRGEWGEKIDTVMQEEGWSIDETNGLYYLPPTELVSDSSLSYLLLNSFTVPD